MRAKIYSILIFIICVCITALVISTPNEVIASPLKWQKVFDSIDFLEIDYGKWFKKGKLYALKIDKPRKLKILVDSEKATTLEKLEKKHNPLIVFNGSYFDETYSPVGFLKVQGKVRNDINKVGSSGILGIKGHEIAIFNKKELEKRKDYYDDILQNGPLLVENNGKMGIYSDDHEYTARTVLGITKDNKILVVIADRTASPSLWEISKLLVTSEKLGGFECKTAINLDGGSSTGIRINLPNKKIVVDEVDYINNAIGVF